MAELADLKQEQASAGQKLGQSEARLRGIQEKVLAVGSRAKHLEQELLQERSSAQSLRDENARLKKEFGQLHSEKVAIEQLLKVHAETLQKLRADSLSIETLLERQAAVQSSLREHADRLRAVAADLRAGQDQAGMAQTAESMAKVLSFTRTTNPEEQPSLSRPNSRVA
jgi:chromosome segregation ATPase